MSPAAGPTEPLAGLIRETFTHLGKTRDVYRTGDGPAVIVIHEMPGLTPAVIEFGRRVAAKGMTAVMPVMFGEPGKAPSASYLARQISWGCVASEFNTWATNQTSPATAWLRALAADAHERFGGPGVGAVGMCFTGGFALAMMVDDAMIAPVLSQPSLPFALGRSRANDLGLSPPDLARVKERAASGVCVLALRFTADAMVGASRFERLRKELGDAFIAVEIDSSPGNPHGISRRAHSVLTEDLVDEPGHPTRAALDEVLSFLSDRLVSAASTGDGPG